jgi:monoamine oxidase
MAKKYQRDLSRREAMLLLGAGTLGIAGCRGPQPAAPVGNRTASEKLSSGAPEPKHVDVVVVGAGFAGMSAARELVRQGKSVVVLEASDRVGGRIKAGKVAGLVVDVGGMWVAPQHKKLLALIERYGLHTTPQYTTGKNITEAAGKRWLADADDLPTDGPWKKEFTAYCATIDRLAGQISGETPWTAARAEEFDRMTVEDWIVANGKDKAAMGLFRASVRSIFEVPPWQLSFLYFLTVIRQGESFENLANVREAAQAFRVLEGMHSVATKLGAELGAAIVLEAPVHSISQTATGVVVHSDRGDWTADYSVVAVPLPLSVRIGYDPPLPPERDLLAQRTPMGSVIKWYAGYAKPFWRDQGLNGLAWTDVPPVSYVYDGTPPSGSPGFLVGFIDNPYATEWMSRPTAERKKVVLDRLVALFGREAGNTIAFEDQNWSASVWARGGYAASMGPGVLTTVGKYLREPHGRIYWAGTEIAVRWTCYVEGAIDSGERAAASIIAGYASPKVATNIRP